MMWYSLITPHVFFDLIMKIAQDYCVLLFRTVLWIEKIISAVTDILVVYAKKYVVLPDTLHATIMLETIILLI